jgi:hypothetical protein
LTKAGQIPNLSDVRPISGALMNRPTIALKPLPNADRAESVMSALAG